MTPVKRVEIVMDAAHIPDLLEGLRGAGATGYTLIRDIHGFGDRGDRGGDHLTNVFRNSLVLVACPAEACPALVEAVRPLLGKYGGMCLVSDAQWLAH